MTLVVSKFPRPSDVLLNLSVPSKALSRIGGGGFSWATIKSHKMKNIADIYYSQTHDCSQHSAVTYPRQFHLKLQTHERDKNLFILFFIPIFFFPFLFKTRTIWLKAGTRVGMTRHFVRLDRWLGPNSEPFTTALSALRSFKTQLGPESTSSLIPLSLLQFQM